MVCQTSAIVPALQKLPQKDAKAASEPAAKGKGGKQKAGGQSKAAKTGKAAAPKRGSRAAAGPAAAGMISMLSRRLLHMHIMLCELLSSPGIEQKHLHTSMPASVLRYTPYSCG